MKVHLMKGFQAKEETQPTNQTRLFQEILLKGMFHLYFLKEHKQSWAADSTVIFSPNIFVVSLILMH